ncbi:hypothetical protein WME91_28255 [Sorangium sp. So ce269]
MSWPRPAPSMKRLRIGLAARGGELCRVHAEHRAPGGRRHLLWFTDGVTGCERAASERRSERRLRALLQSVATRAPEDARGAIIAAVTRLRGADPSTRT